MQRETKEGRRAAGAAVAIVLAVTVPGTGAFAGTLFDPTPQNELRPLSTDRPDVTESPYTLDAGHVQIEADLFSLAREEVDGGFEALGPDRIEIDELRFAQLNVKVGLADRVDLQVVLAPYVKRSYSGPGLNVDVAGSGDLAFRLKVNLAGNDGGDVAVALLPFVSPPTGTDSFAGREPAYGLAVPVARAFSGGGALGLMGQVESDNGTRSFLLTASLGRTIGGALGGFLEIAAERVEPDGVDGYWNNTLDAGLTLGLTPDLQLDGAVLLGLTDEADDWTAYTGITVRR